MFWFKFFYNFPIVRKIRAPRQTPFSVLTFLLRHFCCATSGNGVHMISERYIFSLSDAYLNFPPTYFLPFFFHTVFLRLSFHFLSSPFLAPIFQIQRGEQCMIIVQSASEKLVERCKLPTESGRMPDKNRILAHLRLK